MVEVVVHPTFAALDPFIVLAGVVVHCATRGLEFGCSVEHFREHAVGVLDQLDSFRGPLRLALGVVVHFVDESAHGSLADCTNLRYHVASRPLPGVMPTDQGCRARRRKGQHN